MSFAATWMGLEIVILSTISLTEEEKLILLINKIFKMVQMGLFTRQKQTC